MLGWLLAILLGTSLFQRAVVPGFANDGIRPDLTLVVVVGWGMLRGWEEGLLAGILGGFLTDLGSAAPFGIQIVRLGALGFLSGALMIRIARTSGLIPSATAAIASLGGYVLIVLGLQASGWVVAWERGLIVSALPSALLSAGCMAVFFPALRRLEQRTAAEIKDAV